MNTRLIDTLFLYSKKHVSIVIFLILWELIGRSGLVHISLFPPPTYVAKAFIEMLFSGELLRDIAVSLWRAVAGWLIGSLIAIIVGLATGRNKLLSTHLEPLIQLFRPLPPVAIIPLIIIWFGIGEASKIFSIAFAVFFPVWINTHIGAQNIPKSFLWSAETLHVRKSTIFWKVILPSSLHYIVAGLRGGMAMAFIMVYVSELAGASSGLGYQISVSHLAYRVDRMMAALAVLAILGSSTDYFLSKFLIQKFPWLKLSEKS